MGFSLLSLLGRLAGRARAEADTTAGALAALAKQASLCARIFGLFRAGTLVLDEVDLILHPLKSELNWPLGVKARSRQRLSFRGPTPPSTAALPPRYTHTHTLIFTTTTKARRVVARSYTQLHTATHSSTART